MRKLATLTALVFVALSSSVVLGSADASRTVELKGTEHFVPNAVINADFRFSPGPLSVKSGDVVTWQNTITSPEPHTISIVKGSDLPTNVGQVFNCGAPGTAHVPLPGGLRAGRRTTASDQPRLWEREVRQPGGRRGLVLDSAPGSRASQRADGHGQDHSPCRVCSPLPVRDPSLDAGRDQRLVDS